MKEFFIKLFISWLFKYFLSKSISSSMLNINLKKNMRGNKKIRTIRFAIKILICAVNSFDK